MKVIFPPAAAPTAAAKHTSTKPPAKAEQTPEFKRALDAAEREQKPSAAEAPAPDAPAAKSREDTAADDKVVAEDEVVEERVDSEDGDDAQVVVAAPQPAAVSMNAGAPGASAETSQSEPVELKLTTGAPSSSAAAVAQSAGDAAGESQPQPAQLKDAAPGGQPIDAEAAAPQPADAAVGEPPPQANTGAVARPVQASDAATPAKAAPSDLPLAGQSDAQRDAAIAQELPAAEHAGSEPDADPGGQRESSDAQPRANQATAQPLSQTDSQAASQFAAAMQSDRPALPLDQASASAAVSPALDVSSRESTVQTLETAANQGKTGAEQNAAAGRDEQRVAEQAMRAMRTMINQRGGSLTLRLNPPELGELRIRLEMQQHTVTARFEAANEMVRQLLQQQLPQLHAALSSHGLTVEQIQVQVQTTHGSNQQGSDRQDQPNDGRSRGSFGDTPGNEQRQQQRNEQLTRFQRELLDVVG